MNHWVLQILKDGGVYYAVYNFKTGSVNEAGDLRFATVLNDQMRNDGFDKVIMDAIEVKPFKNIAWRKVSIVTEVAVDHIIRKLTGPTQ